MRPKKITLAPVSDDDGICTSQTPAAGGTQNLTITGALASSGSVTLAAAHKVTIASDGNDSGRTFVVTGTDSRGVAQTESITGPNSTTVTSSNYFLTITKVSINGNATGAIKVGVSGLAATQWVPLNLYVEPFNIGLGVDVITGTLTYSIEHTFDNIQDSAVTPTSFTHASLVTKTTDSDGNYAFPVRATRLITTAFSSGSVAFHVLQGSKGAC